MDERIGDWLETSTGIKFYSLDPRPEEIDIYDIAHALGHICRFNGHCSRFFSVAEHSISVCDILPEEYKLEGLLHDASEAYLCDIPRPLKKNYPWYIEKEKFLQDMIYKKFKVVSTPESKKAVKEADDIALATEAKFLIKSRGLNWDSSAEPHCMAFPLGMEPTLAKSVFLNSFYQLCTYTPDTRTRKEN